jgi:hypothetical protein
MFAIGRTARSWFASVSVYSRRLAWATLANPSVRGRRNAVMARWNGKEWKLVPASAFRGASGPSFSAIEIVSPHEAWAVGSDAGWTAMLLERWDGRAWTRARAPAIAPNDAAYVSPRLSDVTRVPGTRSVLAVGYVLREYLERNEESGEEEHVVRTEPLVLRYC